MIRRRLGEAGIVVLFAGTLVACSGTQTTPEDGSGTMQQPAPVEDATSSTMEPGTTAGLGTQPPGFQGNPLDDPGSLLANRTVYFEFDRSEIRSEDRPTLEAHATYLAGHGSATVTLEGHADERGTREYNIGLGDQRANAVRQLFTLFGASAQQIRTVSYGEERPAVLGHDERAWDLNRRVEIIYRTR